MTILDLCTLGLVGCALVCIALLDDLAQGWKPYH